MDNTARISFIYPVDVEVRGSVRRIAVKGTGPEISFPHDERKLRTNSLGSDRHGEVSVSFLDDGGRQLARIRKPGSTEFSLHPQIVDSGFMSVDTVGLDVFAHAIAHEGHLTIHDERVLDGLHVLWSGRHAIAARAAKFGAGIVTTASRATSSTDRFDYNTPSVETVVGRYPGLKDETQGRGHAVEVHHGWRVHDYTSSYRTEEAVHPRLCRLDDIRDPDFAYRKGFDRIKMNGRTVGLFPEASANLQQMIVFARHACLAASFVTRASADEVSVLALLDDLVAEYSDTLSPAPTTEAALSAFSAFREEVLDAGTPFGAAVRSRSSVVEDARWFEGYWKKRGAALVATEVRSVDDFGTVSSEIDEDDAVISFGLGV